MASKATPNIIANPNWNRAQLTAFERLGRAVPIAMGYLLDEIPVLDNHTDQMLVDEVGDLKKAKKLIEGAEKAHVERLKARLGEKDSLKGEVYEAQFRGSKRVILKQDACKELIEKFDEEGIHIGRLLAAIQSGQIEVPANVALRAPIPATDSGPAKMGETNNDDYYTTSAGGRSLYVDPIA